MLPYKSMILIDPEVRMPIYIQIANGFITEILSGKIASGLKLPGSRLLATQLQVHRKTIVAAYQELETQGWITSIPAKGSFVNDKIPVYKAKGFSNNIPTEKVSLEKANFDFKPRFEKLFETNPVLSSSSFLHRIDDGNPDIRLAPIKALSRHYRSFMNQPSFYKNLGYTNELKGSMHLRKELMQYLSETRSVNVLPENILITRGSVMGFYLLFQTLLQDGGNVLVGATNFQTANNIIQHSKGKLIYVPVDENGIDVDAVEKICKRKTIRAIYIIPHHHHPTTVSLSAERRMKLLMLAEEHNFVIVEDDYDYDFHYDSAPLLPLASHDRFGRVIYVGSLSKSVAPAFRIGFLVGPADLLTELAYFRRIIDRQGDRLLERAIATLFEEGEIRRHLRKALKTYRLRRDHLDDLLQTKLRNCVEYKSPDGGLATWVRFDPKLDLNAISEKAKTKNLFIAPATKYNPLGVNKNAVRFGFASRTEDEMTAAIDVLKSCF